MAISINWPTGVITVPKADLTLIQSSPTEIRELNLNSFRYALKDLEDDDAGMGFPKTHNHNTEITLGGLTFARVIEILDPYSITFEDGQYAVNLVGANSNVGDKVNVNQVSVRSANSAGLISSPAIEYASFNGEVTVNISSPYAGTLYPIGTLQKPVNNLIDALLISTFRGISTIFVLGDAIINSSGNYSNYIFRGQSPNLSLIEVYSSANVTGCEFRDCTLSGVLDGGNVLYNCHIENLDHIDGIIENCLLHEGVIILGGTADVNIINCHSSVLGLNTPTIDYGGSGRRLAIRNYNGGIKITNKTGSDSVSVDLNSGQCILDSSVTAGLIVCRGVGKLVDWNGNRIPSGSWNGCTIVNETSDIRFDKIQTETDKIAYALGLMQSNFLLKNQVYDSNNKLTSGLIRIFANATDCTADTNPIAEYLVAASYDSNGNCISYKVIEN